jgi:AraC-like DNA-binding protein
LRSIFSLERSRKRDLRSSNIKRLCFNGKFTLMRTACGIKVVVREQYFNDEIQKRYLGEFPASVCSFETCCCECADSGVQITLHQIKRSMDAGVTSAMYYEAKVLELMFLQSKSCNADTGRRLPDCDMQAVKATRRIICSQFRDCPKIAELAVMTGTSPSKLQKDFKTAFGITIHECLWETRMTKALELMETSDEPIRAIALAVGCRKAGRFSEIFKKTYGVLPTEYRRARNG